MKHTIPFLGIVTILFLLPGCTRIIDWGKSSFCQGEKMEFDSKTPQDYIRSVTVYDQFYTRGRFDVMWLSDQVRTAYTNLYMLKQGKTEEKRTAFLRRQLAENQHFIVFYVVTPFNYSLGDANSEWSLFLQIADTYFTPVEVKLFDIEPEYKSFFGKHFNRFKITYRVKFEAKDADGKPVLDEHATQLSLHLRSLERKIKLDWNI